MSSRSLSAMPAPRGSGPAGLHRLHPLAAAIPALRRPEGSAAADLAASRTDGGSRSAERAGAGRQPLPAHCKPGVRQ